MTTKTSTTKLQPPIRAVVMGLFPTMDSLQSVVDLGMSQLPVMTPNALQGLLMTYHNTLLKQLEKEKPSEQAIASIRS